MKVCARGSTRGGAGGGGGGGKLIEADALDDEESPMVLSSKNS